jgi:hypothetical protein
MEWNIIGRLFPKFPVLYLKHQIFLLLGTGNSRCDWNSTHDAALIQVRADAMTKEKMVNWKKISQDFCMKIGDLKDFKTQKQCKERWLNHLNPDLKRFFLFCF